MNFNDLSLKKETPQSSIEIKKEIIEDIAITGIGLKLPGSRNLKDFTDHLKMGTDLISKLSDSRKRDCDNYFNLLNKKYEYSEGAFLSDIDKFDYDFFNISPREASLMDPNQRLFLETMWHAIEDSGYSTESIMGSKTGIFLGFGSEADYKNMINMVEPESASIAMMGNTKPVIASRLSHILDFKGPSITVDTTCSSSLVAVHLACQAIKNKECDMAIAGGIQLHINPVRLFNVGIESSSARAKSFDDASDGTGTGEGSIAITLKPLNKAKEDRDNIYAVIKSSAINQDGTSIGLSAPNSNAQSDVIVEAWSKGGVNPETIGYVEAHGTGTKLGDPIEVLGLTKAFKKHTDKRQFCNLSSVKSNIGHLDNAAGIAGLLKSLLSIYTKNFFPLLHFKRPNREINFIDSPLYLSRTLKPWNEKVRRAGVSSFGLSGTNCHIILEQAPQSLDITATKQEELLVISAKSMKSFTTLLGNYKEYLANNSDISIADLCYTSSVGRDHYPIRAAIVTKDKTDLLEKLILIASQKVENIKNDWFFTNLNNSMESRGETDYSGKELKELAKLYTEGYSISWKSVYRDRKVNRIPIPLYPFKQDRCWLNIPTKSEDVKTLTTTPTGKDSFTETERNLATIWGKVLGHKEINVYDDFFDLGGNSMLVIQMELDFEKLGLKITSDDVYEHRNISNLAKNFTPESSEVIIRNIEPFNDVFFKNCYYNSLFPIVNSIGKSIIPFFIYDVILYNRNDSFYSVEYKELLPIEEIFKLEGIYVETGKKTEKIIQEITEGLDRGLPVILSIDAFYLSIRKDAWNKEHMDHTVLIYGYDPDKEIFHIVEHDRRENLTYKKCSATFSDIEASYKGYIENFATQEEVTHTFISPKSTESKNSDYAEQFKATILKSESYLKRSMEFLNKFSEEFLSLTENEDKAEKIINDLVNFINLTINAKNVELYRFNFFFADSEITAKLDEIINLWNRVRKTIARYYYSRKYNNKHFTELNTFITEIKNREIEFNNQLITELRKGDKNGINR